MHQHPQLHAVLLHDYGWKERDEEVSWVNPTSTSSSGVTSRLNALPGDDDSDIECSAVDHKSTLDSLGFFLGWTGMLLVCLTPRFFSSFDVSSIEFFFDLGGLDLFFFPAFFVSAGMLLARFTPFFSGAGRLAFFFPDFED
mmetsp:Transcript_21124/g.44399  ORF Transcript_21124/g.44399 Transcript_21124/m.44399 type:complete len:141 (+) Transcript_21124:1385-1807(+)